MKIGDKVWVLNTVHNNPLDYEIKRGRYTEINNNFVMMSIDSKYLKKGYDGEAIQIRTDISKNITAKTKREAEQKLAKILVNECKKMEKDLDKLRHKAVKLM